MHITLKLDIEDYLSEDEIKTLLKTALSEAAKSHIQKEEDLKRFITNSAYGIVSSLCDTVLDTSLTTKLKEKVLTIIENLSTFVVFKKPDAWDREPNNMYVFLQQIIQSHKSLIQKIVKENVKSSTLALLKTELQETLYESINSLFKTSSSKISDD